MALFIWKAQWTDWGRDNMVANSQTKFSNALSWLKIYWFRLQFHWSLSPKVPINNISVFIQIMAWRRPGAKPLSEPMMTIVLTRICVIRPQWIKSALQCHCQHERWSYSRKQLPIVLFWRSNSTSFIHLMVKCVKMDFRLVLDFVDVTTFSHFLVRTLDYTL